MITIRFLHPLLSINSLLIVVFKLQLIPDTVRQWEPISPLTLDNNERDFTVLAQSIGASYVCVRESGSVAAWVRWWSKEARETMVPYHVLGICVWCKGWVIYYYHHYYPLTTTSMAPIEKTKQKEKKCEILLHVLFFCFCFSGIQYKRDRQHLPNSRWVLQPLEKTTQKSKSSLPHSLFSHLPRNIGTLKHHAAIRSQKFG